MSAAARDANTEPVWELVARHLREVKTIKPLKLNQPRLIGVGSNPGLVTHQA